MARETVEVIFKGKDQLSPMMKSMRSEAGDLARALGIGGMGVGAAIGALVVGAGAAAKSLIDYNKSIKDAADATGMGVEEFSRITQAADDFGISMESVQTALQMATKNGFAPSIESIAELADETNTLASPTERAAELAKVFGRNWAVLNPLLKAGGTAIRDLANSQASGLVVTEREVRTTEQLRLTIDSLNDAWVAWRNEAALPVVEAINLNVRATQLLNSTIDMEAKPTLIEYIKQWHLFEEALRGAEGVEETGIIRNGQLAGAAAQAAEAVKGITAAQYLMQAAEAAIQGDWNQSNVFIDMYRDAKVAERQLLALKAIIEMGARPGPWMIHMGTIRGPDELGGDAGKDTTTGKWQPFSSGDPGLSGYTQRKWHRGQWIYQASGGFAARAGGGLLGTLVGENGPEMITPGGWVKTAGQTERALGMKESVAEMRAIRDEIRWLVRQLPTAIGDAVQMAK